MVPVTVETGVPSELLKNARSLRKNQTAAERLIWNAIRNRKLNNWKFRRQHPIADGFILDFYCAETKVALELDGGYHMLPDQKEYDRNRTGFLAEFGIRVLRISNDEVLSDKEDVLKKIRAFTNQSPLSTLERGRG
jgi:very-short-patch-repair endonuclease